MINKANPNYSITSESVSHGHPDKVADQISDAILDMYIKINPCIRTAIETFLTKNKVIVSGEVYGVIINNKQVESVVREAIHEIGYEANQYNWETVDIEILLHEQSPDIAAGVNSVGDKGGGAGDQGIMYGYAIQETKNLVPSPIFYAHSLLKNIMNAVKNGQIPKIGPDAKTQITFQYENFKPVAVTDIILSIQHPEYLTQEKIREIIHPYVISTIGEKFMCDESRLIVNPTGRFVIGGPVSDCGLTGRKIMVDTYGGHIPHGGGAFSGKDPTKVDRSAAYMARYVAKNIVASGLAQECLVQLAYAIGVSQPISFYINTFGSGIVTDNIITKFISQNIDFSPNNIRKLLSLDNPIYKTTSCYGHVGRDYSNDKNFTWEKDDLSKILNNEFNISKNTGQ